MRALPPAWLTGGVEAPAGEKDMGGWTSRIYTAEQQARLGVDESGNKVEAADEAEAEADGNMQALPPAWLTGGVEAPAGEKDMGGWTSRIYTAEQQARLGVDESGKKVEDEAEAAAAA